MSKHKEPAGPLIASIVIVIILSLGGLYYLVQEIKNIRESGLNTALEIQL